MPDTLSTQSPTVRLHPADNVVVAAARIRAGDRLATEDLVAHESVPSGHKIATETIAPGETVRKYGQVIGVATALIERGCHVHTHNLAVSSRRADATTNAPWYRSEPERSFQGLRRADGR